MDNEPGEHDDLNGQNTALSKSLDHTGLAEESNDESLDMPRYLKTAAYLIWETVLQISVQSSSTSENENLASVSQPFVSAVPMLTLLLNQKGT
jgi:hypothetical protein